MKDETSSRSNIIGLFCEFEVIGFGLFILHPSAFILRTVSR